METKNTESSKQIDSQMSIIECDRNTSNQKLLYANKKSLLFTQNSEISTFPDKYQEDDLVQTPPMGEENSPKNRSEIQEKNKPQLTLQFRPSLSQKIYKFTDDLSPDIRSNKQKIKLKGLSKNFASSATLKTKSPIFQSQNFQSSESEMDLLSIGQTPFSLKNLSSNQQQDKKSGSLGSNNKEKKKYQGQYLQSFNSIYHIQTSKKVNFMKSARIIHKVIKRFKSSPGIWSQQILDLVNDKGYIYSSDDFQYGGDQIEHERLIRKFQNKVKRFRNKGKSLINQIAIIKVIDPENKIQLCLEFLQMMLIATILFLASVAFVFDLEWEDLIYTSNAYFRFFCLLAFIFHILVNLNTGYVEQGQLVMKRTNIMKRYLRRNLFFDLLGMVPIIANMSKGYRNGESYPYYGVECLIFSKYFTLTLIWQRIQGVYNQDESLKTYIKLVNLIIFLINIAHISSLGFFGIAKLESNFGIHETWAHQIDPNIFSLEWYKQYIYSFYWAISAMVTVVVYTPSTINETIFMCIIQFVTCGIFAYSINVLGIIMQDIQKIRNEMQTELEVINRYMAKRQLSVRLRNKVKNYLEYLHQFYQKKTNLQEEQIVEKLSFSLREEILKEFNGRIMDKFLFLKGRFSEKTIQKLLYHIEEVNISQSDQIYHQDFIDDCSLYYIEEGMIQLYHESIRNTDEDSPIILDTLQKSQIFGLTSFITGQQREKCARSLQWGTLYKITRQNFLHVILSEKKDYEQFCYMKDEILYKQNLGVINYRCQICERSSHQALNCPNAHFIPNSIQIIKDYNIPQERSQERKRLQEKKLNSLYGQENLKVSIYNYNKKQDQRDKNDSHFTNTTSSSTTSSSDEHYNDVIGSEIMITQTYDDDQQSGDNSVIWEKSEEQEQASSCNTYRYPDRVSPKDSQSKSSDYIDSQYIENNTSIDLSQLNEHAEQRQKHKNMFDSKKSGIEMNNSLRPMNKSYDTQINKTLNKSYDYNNKSIDSQSSQNTTSNGLYPSNHRTNLGLNNITFAQQDEKENRNQMSIIVHNESFQDDKQSVKYPSQRTIEIQAQQPIRKRFMSSNLDLNRPKKNSFDENHLHAPNPKMNRRNSVSNSQQGSRRNSFRKQQQQFNLASSGTKSSHRTMKQSNGGYNMSDSDGGAQQQLQNFSQYARFYSAIDGIQEVYSPENNSAKKMQRSKKSKREMSSSSLFNRQVQGRKMSSSNPTAGQQGFQNQLNRSHQHHNYQQQSVEELMSNIQVLYNRLQSNNNNNNNITNTNNYTGGSHFYNEQAGSSTTRSNSELQMNSSFFRNQQVQPKSAVKQPTWIKNLQETRPRNMTIMDQRRKSLQQLVEGGNLMGISESKKKNSLDKILLKKISEEHSDKQQIQHNNNHHHSSMGNNNSFFNNYFDEDDLDIKFETLCEYQIYYPEGNYNKVIKKALATQFKLNNPKKSAYFRQGARKSTKKYPPLRYSVSNFLQITEVQHSPILQPQKVESDTFNFDKD